MDIPVWRKYALSVEEAASYFNLGENRIRDAIRSKPNAEWILWAGNRAAIKRVKFEQYLDRQNTI